MKSGPEWIREDVKIVNRLQEASRRAFEDLPPNLMLYSNVHAMSRRVRVLPKDFEHIVDTTAGTSLQLYLEELTSLAIALDDKVHREGFD